MSSHEPRTLFEDAADDALKLINQRCAELGRPAERVFITFAIEGEGRPNAVTVYDTPDEEETAADLFAFLLAQVQGIGKQLGMNVIFAPMSGGGPLS